jgi:hypothetical protein
MLTEPNLEHRDEQQYVAIPVSVKACSGPKPPRLNR